jgi:hypothetical protein
MNFAIFSCAHKNNNNNYLIVHSKKNSNVQYLCDIIKAISCGFGALFLPWPTCVEGFNLRPMTRFHYKSCISFPHLSLLNTFIGSSKII